MNIDKHFELLLTNYNLKELYIKFLISNSVTQFLKEGFYWALLYFSNLVKGKPETIFKNSAILISMVGLHVPSERLTNYFKSNFIEQIKIANTKYFNEKIINLSKDQLLTFDLVEYYAVLDHLNDGFDSYISNIKSKYDIPFRIVSLIIIALNKKFVSLIGLFAIYYFIVRSLNENKFIKETELTKQYFEYDGIIRNYLVNSKNFLINDEFNKDYLTKNIEEFGKISNQISEINNTLNMNINFTMFGFIIIVIWTKFHELNQFDFLYYFLIIYDIEYIGDKVMEYYKNKTGFNKMQERLIYLNSFKTTNNNLLNKSKITNIKINNISNTKPKVALETPINIKPNDHILLEGESGSGKTSLLYILKGILKPEQIEIYPDLNQINSQTYLTLPNHKSLFSGKLYDIISNYSSNPNIELINFALSSAKINDRLFDNNYVDVEKLSSGERIRLLIARIIYTIKTKEYNILLFDEIDENLNDELALEVWNNLSSVLNDKIIIYITHNEQVKKLFDKRFLVKDGVIISQ